MRNIFYLFPQVHTNTGLGDYAGVQAPQNLNYFNQLLASRFIIVLLHRQYLSTPNCMSSTTSNSSQTSQRTMNFRQKFKTEKCRYWYERGFCPFYQLCAFAHNEDQLRDKHALNMNYKTKLCSNFKNNGYCKYGDRCQFLHVQEAPTVLTRSILPDPDFPSPNSDKKSDSTSQELSCKHQFQLSLLTNYDLDFLNVKKSKRSTKWQNFMEEGGQYQYENDGSEWWDSRENLMDFSNIFPDYDFCRKPRLGSM